MKEFCIKGFVSEDVKTRIILKANKIGYDVRFDEYGVSTYVTFYKFC